MKPENSRWIGLVGLALILAVAAPGIQAQGRTAGHAHGYQRYGAYHGHGHGYYGHAGWPYVGLYGYYGLYGGYWGYGVWPPYYPRAYPVPVYGHKSGDEPGAVETDVKPARAAIRVDGEDAGQARDFNGTWDVLWLAPGSHELEFSRDGYRTLKVHVDVDAGSYYRIKQRLDKGSGLDPRSLPLPEATAPPEREPTPAADQAAALQSGFLTIDAEPADAAVYLDGRFLANAAELARLHGALPVAEGEHTIEVVRPGFRSVTERVTVEADRTATVSVRLERAGGSS